MAGVNKVIIVGRLGNDPEMRTMPSGEAVANISVATSDVWTDRTTNERREKTEWHRIVLFRRQAEVAGEYLRKGSQVYVEGRLQTRKWQDQNGIERYTTEIIGDTLTMLGSRSDNMGQGGYHQGQYQQSQPNYGHQGGYQRQPSSAPQPAYTAPRTETTPASRPPKPSMESLDVVGGVIDEDIPF